MTCLLLPPALVTPYTEHRIWIITIGVKYSLCRVIWLKSKPLLHKFITVGRLQTSSSNFGNLNHQTKVKVGLPPSLLLQVLTSLEQDVRRTYPTLYNVSVSVDVTVSLIYLLNLVFSLIVTLLVFWLRYQDTSRITGLYTFITNMFCKHSHSLTRIDKGGLFSSRLNCQ